MALSVANGGQYLTDVYLSFAALLPDGMPSGNPSTGDFPSGWAAAYSQYAKEGEVLGATNDGGDPSILEAYLRSSSTSVHEFAVALAEFWATVAVTAGPPGHGGIAPISVSNDSLAHVADFEAAIEASLTDQEMKPYWSHFLTNVEQIALSTIIWTVTELMPGAPPAPVPFSETIV